MNYIWSLGFIGKAQAQAIMIWLIVETLAL